MTVQTVSDTGRSVRLEILQLSTNAEIIKSILEAWKPRGRSQ